MKRNNLLLIGAVAIGAFLIYRKFRQDTTNSGRELAPPPVAKPIGKPSVSPRPKTSVMESENTISEQN